MGGGLGEGGKEVSGDGGGGEVAMVEQKAGCGQKSYIGLYVTCRLYPQREKFWPDYSKDERRNYAFIDGEHNKDRRRREILERISHMSIQ